MFASRSRLSRAAMFCLLALLLLLFSGCQQQDLNSIFPREQITSLSISYMGYIGDDIPSAQISTADPAFSDIVDALYSATPVSLDLSQAQSYSPEMNASHILYLYTASGAMPLYADSFHGIYSVPLIRVEEETHIRTYLTFQPAADASGAPSAIWQYIEHLEPARTEPQSVLDSGAQQFPSQGAAAPDLSVFSAPDDSALRAQVERTTISASGETILFESSSNPFSPQTPLYHAFSSSTLSGVAPGRMYIAACPEAATNQYASISSITKVDGALLVRVQLSDRQDQSQNVALIDQSVLTDGMKVIFLRDEDADILYVQSYTAMPAAE